MEVYYHEALRPIIDEIGANYGSTVSDENEKNDINVAESFDIGKMNEDDTVDVPALPIISQNSPINSQNSPIPEHTSPVNTQTPLLGRSHYCTLSWPAIGISYETFSVLLVPFSRVRRDY